MSRRGIRPCVFLLDSHWECEWLILEPHSINECSVTNTLSTLRANHPYSDADAYGGFSGALSSKLSLPPTA